MPNSFYKNNKDDTIWWNEAEQIGVWEFFDKENPEWKEFFSDRK